MPSENTTNLGIRSFFNCISSCFHPLNHHSHTAPGGSRAPPSPAAIEEKPFESDCKESSRGDEPCSATFSDSESCSICLNEFNASGMALKILPKCGHVFHKACIDEWLPSRSLNCPVCRDRAVDDKLIRKSRPRDEVLDPMTAFTVQFSSRAASTRTSRRHFYAL